MASRDVRTVYFPWLILTAIAFSLSYAGGKSKPSHLVVPNWLIMMGFIENFSLLTQIVMTFKFGTFKYAISIIIAYILYLLGNSSFSIIYRLKIAKVDSAFQRWLVRPENNFTSKVLLVGGSVFSWKFYKLLYSHNFGYNIKNAVFKSPAAFRTVQKWFLIYNCATTYWIVVLTNIIGLITTHWGT
jgi:hypothetical protein